MSTPPALRRRPLLGAALGLALPGGCAHRPCGEPGFMERRAAHPTRLRERGPAPARWREHAPPAGAIAVRVPSEGRELLAWYARPEASAAAPALVFFHGELSLWPSDFAAVRPFLAAGFAVLTPSLRGENGNPGDFELLRGELDDARAAVRWLADQPGIDGARIHALGHSVGGALAALLSLVPGLPLATTASAGGIYVPETFRRWREDPDQAKFVRFDPDDRHERELRVLGPHIAGMVRPHVAYVGDADPPIARNAAALRELAAPCHGLFTALEVAGDHMTMLAPAVARYLERCR